MKQIGKFDIIGGGRHVATPVCRNPEHWHNYHEITVVERGVLHSRCANGRRLELCAGEAVFYPGGVRHAEHSDPQEPPVFLFVSFNMEAKGLPMEVTRAVDRQGRMGEILRWFHEHCHHVEPVSGVECEALGVVLLEEFLRAAGGGGASLAKATRDYVRQHIAEPLTIDALAAHAGLSRPHFARRYKAETGVTPMQDVREIRAHHARRLIVYTKTPLKEIAAQVGLGKGPMLYETFRKVFGRSPAQFRRRGRGGDLK